MTRRRLVLYLDQSDLCYLAFRRGPGNADYAGTRDALVDLSRRGVVRVRTSMAHLTESLGLGWRDRWELVQLLRELPDSGFSCAYPGEIWEAELDGRAPVLDDVRISTTTPLFWASFVFFSAAGRPLTALGARLRRTMKHDLRAIDPAVQRAVSSAVLENDPDLLPGGKRPLRNRSAFLVQRRAWRSMQKRGFSKPFELLDAHKRGLTGFGMLDERIRRDADLNGSSERAATKPACALSVAVRRSVGGDLGRVDLESDELDAMHVAYAAYSDVATVDKRVLSAVRRFEKHVPWVRWWPTGKLDELIETIASAAHT